MKYIKCLLLWFFFISYLIKLFARLLAPILIHRFANKMKDRFKSQFNQQYQNQERSSRKEGEITIEGKKSSTKKSDKIGEYVDFEEVED